GGVRREDALQFGEELGGAAERETRLDAILEGADAQLLEAERLVDEGLLVGEVGERGAAPELQRVAENGRRDARVARGDRRAPALREVVEALAIERARRHRQPVAGRPRLEQPARAGAVEQLAQLGDVRLQ